MSIFPFMQYNTDYTWICCYKNLIDTKDIISFSNSLQTLLTIGWLKSAIESDNICFCWMKWGMRKTMNKIKIVGEKQQSMAIFIQSPNITIMQEFRRKNIINCCIVNIFLWYSISHRFVKCYTIRHRNSIIYNQRKSRNTIDKHRISYREIKRKIRNNTIVHRYLLFYQQAKAFSPG